jgi:dihydrofolate reductase
MTIVTAQMSVSVDGCYAGPRYDDVGTWLEGPEAAGFFRVTRWAIDAEAWRQRLGFTGGQRNVNSEIIQETFDAAGAYVMGRRMADGGEMPWGDDPPFHAPVFVVTHRPRPILERLGGTSFTYVTDGITSAVEQARAAANGKTVAVSGGGTLLRQVISLGLVDELIRSPHRAGDPRGRSASAQPRNRTQRVRGHRADGNPGRRGRRRHTRPLPRHRPASPPPGQPWSRRRDPGLSSRAKLDGPAPLR